MCPSLLPRGLACLHPNEGISTLSEEKRRIYKTASIPELPQSPFLCHFPPLCLGCLVKGEKSWEKQPTMDGRCLCCKCHIQSEELFKSVPCGSLNLWLEVSLSQFLGSGVRIHRGGQHPAPHFTWSMLGDSFALEPEGHGKSQWAWVKSLLHRSVTEACDISKPSYFYLWTACFNMVTSTRDVAWRKAGPEAASSP